VDGTIGVGGSGDARDGLRVENEDPDGEAGCGPSNAGKAKWVGLILEVGLLAADVIDCVGMDPVAKCVGSGEACGEARGVNRSPLGASDLLVVLLIPWPSSELPAETVRERSNSVEP